MFKEKNILFICFLIFIALTTFLTSNIMAQSSSIEDSQFLAQEQSLDKSVIFILVLIIFLIILFVWEPLPISLLAVLVPITLSIFSSFSNISVDDALSGFGNPATITVMAMFVFSAGIQRSGAVQLLGEWISNITGQNPRRQIAFISILTGSTSGFINNTPVVAALIPMVRELGRKTNVSPSKLLIPLSYTAMLGGTVTLIGTSTNLLASQVSARLINHPFSLFEFTGLGLIVLIIGVTYILTIGYKLIPARIDVEEDLTDEYEMRDYLTEVLVEENCDFVGRSVEEIERDKDLDYDIIRIIRDGKQFMEPLNAKTIRTGDHLIIRAKHETMLELVKSKGMKSLPELIVNDKSIEQPLKGELLVEVVVPSNSMMVNKTLEEMHFLDRYDCNILALRRGEEITHQDMRNYRFKPGDLLLMLVTENTLERFRRNSNFIIDREFDSNVFDIKKILISAAILLFFIICVAFNILPVAIAALTGAFLMVFTGCINKGDFFKAIDWEVYFLLAGLIPMGIAIEKSGTASYIADQIISVSTQLHPLYILMLIYLITSILTTIISNNASVLIMLPIAVSAAAQLGVNPFAFVLTTTFAASSAFASPVGYQTNLMIYSSGGFKFRDFIVVGAPLQIILTISVPILVRILWGF